MGEAAGLPALSWRDGQFEAAPPGRESLGPALLAAGCLAAGYRSGRGSRRYGNCGRVAAGRSSGDGGLLGGVERTASGAAEASAGAR